MGCSCKENFNKQVFMNKSENIERKYEGNIVTLRCKNCGEEEKWEHLTADEED